MKNKIVIDDTELVTRDDWRPDKPPKNESEAREMGWSEEDIIAYFNDKKTKTKKFFWQNYTQQ